MTEETIATEDISSLEDILGVDITATVDETTGEQGTDPEEKPAGDPEPQPAEETLAAPEDQAGIAIEMKKFVLQALLDKGSTVLPNRDVMPVLKNFLLDAKPGQLRITSTDLELSILLTTQMVKVTRPGVIVIPGKKLLDIVKEAEDGDLVLDAKAGAASIKVGKTSWEVRLMDENEYPDLPEVEDIEMHVVDRSKFLASLMTVRHAAATDTVRPSLMMIDITNGRVRAADGVRFCQANLPDFPIDIQIPINAVDDLTRLLRTTEVPKIEVGHDENYLLFKVNEDIFITNKLSATFPDVDEVLLKPALANEDSLHADRQELLAAIKRVRINADPETSAIVLTLAKGSVTIKAKDKFGNFAIEAVDADWEHADREVAVNHVHFSDMLQAYEAKSAHIKLGPDGKQRKSPLLLLDEQTGQKAVLNQLRLDLIS